MFRAKTSKSETGELGENIACEYLNGKGYRILERNYWKPWGEIDIVAVTKTNTLVFIEVKTLKENPSTGLLPEDNLTSAKLKKLQRVCRGFVADKPELVREDRGWQIDLVAVKIPAGADKPSLKNCDIRHYENI
ncbi:MAG: YraN family protein [Candidatus Liptonbacteria bacterium]|nr:YraN family protein [Candidatus Liptonbacteria bacterium]